MTVLYLKLISGTKVITNWYGKKLPETANIKDVFFQFISGQFDGTNVQDSIEGNFENGGVKISVLTKKTDSEFIEADSEFDVNDIYHAGQYVIFSDMLGNTEATNSSSQPGRRNNVFIEMMKRSHEATFLPSPRDSPVGAGHHHDRLGNDVIIWLRTSGLGWTASSVDSLGEDFVRTMVGTMWYVDGRHDRLEDRYHGVPTLFVHFQGYNKPRKRSHEPFDSKELKSISDRLFELSGKGYLKQLRWESMREGILRLADNLRRHSDYLASQNERNHTPAKKPMFAEKYDWRSYKASSNIKPTLQAIFKSMHESLMELESFTALCINNFLPDDSARRCDFINNLLFPIKTVRFSYTSLRRHLHFVWWVPETASETDLFSKNDEVATKLKAEFPKHYSRIAKREFFAKFGRMRSFNSAELRLLHRELTGDTSAARNEHEAEIDARLKQVIDSEDVDLIWDLRVNNHGRPEEFGEFLELRLRLPRNVMIQ